MADFCKFCDNFCERDEGVCDKCLERTVRRVLEEQLLDVRAALTELLASPDLKSHDRELAEAILKRAAPLPVSVL